MKLSRYLTANKIPQWKFAETIGVNQSYVSQLCHGIIWPSREMMVKIADATDNKVRANDFVDLPMRAKAKGTRAYAQKAD